MHGDTTTGAVSRRAARVTDDGYGATVAKRRLSRVLVAMRVRAGLSVNEATDKLGSGRDAGAGRAERE